MPVYRTQALILHNRKYGEADCLLTLLTQERGKIGAIAKGARKPASRLRGGVQPLTHSQLLLHDGRNLKTVTQAEPVESFAGLHGDVERFAHAAYLAELVDRFTLDNGGMDLFALLLTSWHLMVIYPAKLVTCHFELKLLAKIGYCPELESCVACGGPLTLPGLGGRCGFSPGLGGLVGPCCRERHTMGIIPVATNTVAFLRHLLVMDPRQVDRLVVGEKVLKQATGVMRQTLKCRLEGNFRSWAVIDAISNSG
ncbi:MAG: DNA repair protein RecO [Heliobacteriaceae bacterium]|nr:DNA repair protein RecO [Heliobacteriaceae bacterium]MDD4586852.1 DNA repair protein RecO [Heliobacteriaceae bacterium]